MPLFEEKKATNQTENCGFETSNQTQPKKQESSLIKTIGQLLPLAPFVYEQFTGQKVPQMSGTMAEMQMALVNIQSGMQTIVNNQNSLNQRLIQLETKLSEIQTSAANQFNNLTHQFKSLRLTHTKEHKRIEYDNPSLEENPEY